MAAPKKPVLKALSDAHLRAIGMVAANWSRLEVTLIWALGRLSDLDFKKAVILAGSQNPAAVCDMIQKLTTPEGETKPKKTELSEIIDTITKLQRERNNIVHTYWLPPNTNKLIELLGIELRRPTARDTVRGTGIPKRGKNVFLNSSYTTKGMLDVAKKIDDLDSKIQAWVNSTLKARALAAALRSGGKLFDA